MIVDRDALYVVDGKFWTSAGVSTGIDMALAMVSADLGGVIASEVAKRLVLYVRRPGYQSQFSALLRAQVRADNPFGELIAWMQGHLDEPLDVATLASRSRLSERTFYRKFVDATGETPARFVESLRLDAARVLLSQELSIKAIAALHREMLAWSIRHAWKSTPPARADAYQIPPTQFRLNDFRRPVC